VKERIRMGSKFIAIKDGEAVTLPYVQALKTKGANMNFACCDCGLVHNVVFIPLKTRIKLYLWRDNRRTANRRRRRRRRMY